MMRWKFMGQPVRFPMMSTQELIDWAKACHPNVSTHAYDSR